MDIAYDGTAFSGWAVQPGFRTVQGELESALATVLRMPVALTVAGRTDAGVHATGQVAHFDVPVEVWSAAQERLLRQLAGVLTTDVRVSAVCAVPAEFDARFSALWRSYEYVVTDSVVGADPLHRAQTLVWPRTLDVAAMASAAPSLVGLHNFAAFCKRRDNATTIRTVLNFDVERDGGLIKFSIRADAFCHSMVRSLVGALIAVGDGRRGTSWPATLLERTSRADEITVAAARGLTLIEVRYPAGEELAARARETRTVRTLPALERPSAD